MLWELRSLRRRRGKCFGSCATCADVSTNALRTAQPAQTSRQMLWELRNLRRCRGKCFGSCATCADVAANALGVAQPAQTSRGWRFSFNKWTRRTPCRRDMRVRNCSSVQTPALPSGARVGSCLVWRKNISETNLFSCVFRKLISLASRLGRARYSVAKSTVMKRLRRA